MARCSWIAVWIDVYKRQVPTLQDFHGELLRQPEPEARDVALAIEPVSYTHLYPHGIYISSPARLQIGQSVRETHGAFEYEGGPED